MPDQWQGTTYGNKPMHKMLVAILRRVDIRCIYLFTYLFVVPPCLLRRGFKPIYRLFRRRFGQSVLQSLWNTYRNHCLFAETVVDKFAMYAGRGFGIEIEGYEHFHRLAHNREGFVQLSSHMGNYEIAGYSLVAKDKRFNALVYSGEKQTIMDNRVKMFSHTNIRMICNSGDMSHLFLINDALANGEIVSIAADRRWGSGKTVKVQLMGGVVQLPQGPFRVVCSRELEALVVHVMKKNWKTYTIHVNPLSYSRDVSRSEQVECLARGYAAVLEEMLGRYPTQWFNYFDLWS